MYPTQDNAAENVPEAEEPTAVEPQPEGYQLTNLV